MTVVVSRKFHQVSKVIKSRVPFLFLLCAGFTHSLAPAHADSSLPTTPALTEPTPSLKSANNSSSKSSGNFVTHIPITLASFVVGTAIGTPIAMVRCTHIELKKRTKEAKDLGGVRPKPLAYLSAGVFGIPSGILSGVWSGTFNGISDSWRNSKDAPFSKETFSLDTLELYK